jgi:hypothetical protein
MLTRETEELRDETEIEAQKGVDAQLERVLMDLGSVRQANRQLEETIR